MKVEKKLSMKIVLILMHVGFLYLILQNNSLCVLHNIAGFVLGTFAFNSIFLSAGTICITNGVKYSKVVTALPFFSIIFRSVSDLIDCDEDGKAVSQNHAVSDNAPPAILGGGEPAESLQFAEEYAAQDFGLPETEGMADEEGMANEACMADEACKAEGPELTAEQYRHLEKTIYRNVLEELFGELQEGEQEKVDEEQEEAKAEEQGDEEQYADEYYADEYYADEYYADEYDDGEYYADEYDNGEYYDEEYVDDEEYERILNGEAIECNFDTGAPAENSEGPAEEYSKEYLEMLQKAEEEYMSFYQQNPDREGEESAEERELTEEDFFPAYFLKQAGLSGLLNRQNGTTKEVTQAMNALSLKSGEDTGSGSGGLKDQGMQPDIVYGDGSEGISEEDAPEPFEEPKPKALDAGLSGPNPPALPSHEASADGPEAALLAA
ncbi:uncharacterized protein NEMAJ01_1365 [Nematocida major]|uniref:uncharacterized protein n=1 Tax=Nematocida major TaxID=1912982 RepID=UPI00200839B1|nr:uncharacterized protein NEMAJ01_1365 [Nematocida major]KAH9386469.1 hypothetical protein NEMAJ01_1365 [Nematocida major]